MAAFGRFFWADDEAEPEQFLANFDVSVLGVETDEIDLGFDTATVLRMLHLFTSAQDGWHRVGIAGEN